MSCLWHVNCDIRPLSSSSSLADAWLMAYPKPTKPTPPYDSINPRPLCPLRPPPTNPRIPKLPAHIENFRRDVLNILPGFTLSTHVFPAASTRTKCGPERIPNLSKERGKRKEEASVVAEGLLKLRCEWLPAVYECKAEEPPLWLSLNRFYRPGGFRVAPGRKALTLWLLHANGFHKEVSWLLLSRNLVSSDAYYVLGSLDLGGDIEVYCI